MFKKILLATALILGSIGNAFALQASTTECTENTGIGTTTGTVTTYIQASYFDIWNFKTVIASVRDSNGKWYDSPEQDLVNSSGVDYTFNIDIDENVTLVRYSIQVKNRNGGYSGLDFGECN